MKVTEKERPVVGIDVTAAMTQGAGIGRYTRELVRALVEEDDGNAYLFFSARPPAELPVSDPLPLVGHVAYRQAPLDAQWLYRIWHRLRLPVPVQAFTGPLKLFHSPDFVLPPVWGHIPTLLTVHDLSFLHYPQTFTPALIKYLNRVVPRSIRRATHVLADSEATKADLVDLWQVAPEKVTVLYSGVARRFRPVTDPHALHSAREKYDIGDLPYLLSVGTVQPRKNYQLLIRAFRPVAERWPHKLVIAGGKGWLYEEVLREVEHQGLVGRVHFTGFVADEDLPALYTGASLFLFPSLYEGFGLPLLEAMACGVPVLASDSSSLPEVAGEAARLLPPTDEVVWSEEIDFLLQNAPQRARLASAGLARVRHFTWQRSARQLRDIYATLLSRA